jgi:hypothetical protein
MQDTRFTMQDAGYKIHDAGYKMENNIQVLRFMMLVAEW